MSDSELCRVVILPRIDPDTLPNFTPGARVTCMGTCQSWCWAGKESLKLIVAGEVEPLCVECATVAFAAYPEDVEFEGEVIDP